MPYEVFISYVLAKRVLFRVLSKKIILSGFIINLDPGVDEMSPGPNPACRLFSQQLEGGHFQSAPVLLPIGHQQLRLKP